MLISIFGIEDQQCQKNQLRHPNHGFWIVALKDQFDGQTLWNKAIIEKVNRSSEEKDTVIT